MANADRIIELLHEAKGRPAGAEREQFLSEACGDDAALKEQIVSLLEAGADDGGSFLKSTLLLRPTAPVTEKPGDRIGRYKLLEQIGEGGCGVVYMAEQQEPVRRRVALKVIKLGMDTKQVIARFEAERQALALMDHPNIAKVLDGGATDTGRPFFVMELVRGIKITDYCDQNNLSTNERLELFIQVCQAIQHAHQKGIIHRDIKPSNILVTLHDDVAMPKVIDFGIAKATVGQLTDKTVFTAFAQFIGTPAYMSPEQAQMSGLDIDTRADIYSLGVLLYELLTGSTPFDARELLAAGLDEMRRRIREDEPARPSTCLSTMEATALTAVARQRHAEPPKLIHLVRGDLDWLVMKCLEKDRMRRYETANALAMDLQRHLNDEPVVARPPSTSYRFQKLVRRNKLAFGAIAAVAMALVMGVVVSSWQALRATRAEHEQIKLREEADAGKKQAQTEAAKSEQVARFLEDMLTGVGPSVALGRDTTMLREILDKTAERVGKELTNQPLVEAELRSTMGSTYLQLNETEKAETMEREALRLRISILGETNELVATSLNELARVLARQGKSNLPQAEITIRMALAMRRNLLGEERKVASSLALLAGVLQLQGNLPEAETASREALAIRRKSLGNEHSEVASSLDNLALILQARGNLPEAEANLREALAMQRKLLGETAPDVATSLKYLARNLQRQGKLAEAEAAYRETWELHKKLYPDNHQSTAEICSALIAVLNSQGKTAEAKKLSLDELTRKKQVVGSEVSAANVQALTKLGSALQARGQIAEAETAFRKAVDMGRKVFGNERPEDPSVLGSLAELGRVLRSEGKLAESEAVFRERLQRVRNSTNAFELSNALVSLAHTLLEEQKFADAEPVLRELLAVNEKGNFNPEFVVEDRRMLGNSLQGQKKYAEAEALLLSSYEDSAKFKTIRQASVEDLVRLYKATGQTEQATEWEKLWRDDSARQRKLLGSDASLATVQGLTKLAATLRRQKDLTQAEATYREAVEMGRKVLGDHPAVADALHGLGGTFWDMGKLSQTEVAYRDDLAMRRKIVPAGDIGLVISLTPLADFLRQYDRSPEAEPLYREALAIRREALGPDKEEVASSLESLALALRRQNKIQEAEVLYRQALATRREVMGGEHPKIAAALYELSFFLRDQGKLSEAESTARETLTMRKKLLGSEHADVAQSLHLLAWNLNLQGKHAEAESSSREELAIRRKLLGNEHIEVGATLGDLAFFLRDQGKMDELDAVAREAITMYEKLAAKNPAQSDLLENLGHSQWHLARALDGKGQSELAQRTLQNSLEVFEKAGRDFPKNPFFRQEQGFSHRLLGELAVKLGKTDDAERHYRAASGFYAGLKTESPENAFYRGEVGSITWTLATMLDRADRPDSAFAEYHKSLSTYEQAVADFPGDAGLKTRRDEVRVEFASMLRRRVPLFVAASQSGKAAEWKKQLAEFDKAQAEKKSAAPKP